MMGMTWISSGYLLYKEGYITGSTDPSQYGVEDTTNLKGSSINVPWLGSIPLNRIEPLGSFFRLSADYYEIYDEYNRLKGIIEKSQGNPQAVADLEALEEMKNEFLNMRSRISRPKLSMLKPIGQSLTSPKLIASAPLSDSAIMPKKGSIQTMARTPTTR